LIMRKKTKTQSAVRLGAKTSKGKRGSIIVRLGPGPHDVVRIQPPAVLPSRARQRAIGRAVAEVAASSGRRWPKVVAER